jgi:S-adenosylmethionine decarboxylase
VLSESSLFVYDHRLIMKTCGTTTLLRCLGTLFEYADKMGMQLSWVGYSRKNFLFPTAQLWPHVNFGEEMRYIEQHESLQKRLRGDGHILGPVTGDHWFVYVADGSPSASGHTTPSAALYGNASNTSSVMDFRALGLPARASTSSLPTILADADARDARSNSLSTNSTAGDCEEDESGKTSPQPASLPSSVGHSAAAVTKSSVRSTELNTALTQLQAQRHSSYRTFNMMMFDMDPAVAATFFQGTNGLTGKEMTEAAGIPALCPGYQVDEAAFSPCGYSMNAVLGPSYATIHITPEAQCSYVSYETNEALDDYAPLLRRVLATFRPGRFVLTMFGDDDAIDMLPRVPTSTRVYGDIKGCPEGAHYLRTSSTCTTVESQRQQCIMACYTYQQLLAAGVGAEAAV